ncbi:MAG: hypothetical protein HPY70_04090 [Firmicutes bacterium]|nr:hypothetical protein [Bacillota bacterium]
MPKARASKKVISVLLAVLLLFGSLDGLLSSMLHARAYASSPAETRDTFRPVQKGYEDKKPHPTKDLLKDIIQGRQEQKDRRTQNSKTFIDNQGKKTQIIFIDRIHFKDNKGQWEDIDNTIEQLKPAHPRSAVTGSDTADFKYTNRANDYSVKFTGKGIPAVSFTYQGTTIEFSPEGAKASTAVVEKNAVLYPEIYQGVDLEYRTLNSALKEDIILTRYTGRNEFKFNIKAGSIKLIQEGNTIKACRDNDCLYRLSPPYAVDADGNTTDRIDIKLTGGKGSIYTLELVIDPDWLKARDRVYPVKIDPSLTLGPPKDAYAEERYPDTLTYPQQHLYIGYDDGIASNNGTYHKKETITT